MDTLDTFSMMDIERLTGIKAHTLRAWEKRYGVPWPKRSAKNIRYFDNEDLKLLLTIRMLNKFGWRIQAIAKMSAEDREFHLLKAIAVNGGDAHINETLLSSLLHADERKFANVYHSLVTRLGTEQAFIQALLPFFERVGVLWQTGTIEPAQEHFFFNLVRQKLLAAVDGLGLVNRVEKGTVLLFLPEHELHELGLLFYNYALRARGYRTIYLGQSVPLKGLERMIRMTSPEMIITGITHQANPIPFDAFYKDLKKIAGRAKIYYTGLFIAQVKPKYKGILGTEDLIKWLQSQPVLLQVPA
ncbi:MAG TPA: MerR family transcriptional regulator [Puia sp.]|uniref:MerR family transcriptional regulator n=1 Tax=Puia sp. TaxID=2045100 RepID=UPI002C0AFC8E|nr:MerR family transcriptional regulator [Puia sp.]HVU94868.1 MerR family transcriptional regulator [Puia sp.]